MIDYARIKVIAGSGGNGTGSFEHVKGKRRGKADGGDGGRGGNVYILATTDMNTLERFRFAKEYKAKNGEMGLSKRRKGAEAEDLYIKVPVGTQVKVKNQTIESIDSNFDLSSDGQSILIARSGDGGRGNSHLRDEYGRRPYAGEKGQIGETIELTLELKLIADVGLIGLPNAGKSTLLSKLTLATPKIADYPFTTLEPNLGVTKSSLNNSSLVIADIPGLIEGASSGKGLGDLFLRHIERTKILVHMIDATSDDVWKDYQTIRGELKAYSKELVKKSEIVVLNKSDLVPDITDKLTIFKSKKKPTIAISAQNSQGIDDLVNLITRKLA